MGQLLNTYLIALGIYVLVAAVGYGTVVVVDAPGGLPLVLVLLAAPAIAALVLLRRGYLR